MQKAKPILDKINEALTELRALSCPEYKNTLLDAAEHLELAAEGVKAIVEDIKE